MAAMTITLYVHAALFLTFVYYVVSTVRAYWRLRHFKGPLLAAWSDLWYIRAATSGKCHLHLSEVNTKYGPLARIGPNTLLTCDGELFRKINTPRTGYFRDRWYQSFRFGAEVDNVFSEIDNDRHLYLRKRVALGYSGKDNPQLEEQMDAVVFSLIKSWKERYVVTRQKMDFAVQVQYLTLDMATALSLSQPFGYLSSNSDLYEYISTMAANLPVMFFMSAVPLLSRITRIPWVQRILSPSVKDRVGIGKIKAIANEIIARRFAEAEVEVETDAETAAQGLAQKDHGDNKQSSDAASIGLEKDMTSSFIAHGLTHAEVADEALLTIFAGSDTVAAVVRTGLISILTQPRILRSLQAECDAADVPEDQIISYARALQLPYLQACIKEALRTHPVATGLIPRVVPPQGDHFRGQFIPGGTVIAQCGWNLHRRNFEVYGSDAEFFRPERWIEAQAEAEVDAETDAVIKTSTPFPTSSDNDTNKNKDRKRSRLDEMERAQELVFGYGEFKCLGHRIATIELCKLFFELMRRYEFGLVNGLLPMEKNVNCGLFVQKGLWVVVDER